MQKLPITCKITGYTERIVQVVIDIERNLGKDINNTTQIFQVCDHVSSTPHSLTTKVSFRVRNRSVSEVVPSRHRVSGLS